MSEWKEGYSQSPGKCLGCGGFIPAGTYSLTRYNDQLKKWERAHTKCIGDYVIMPPCSPPPSVPEPTPCTIAQAADLMVGSGKMIAKEFVRTHPNERMVDQQFPSEGFDEMHCLLHLDHEMRERMVEQDRIMILQIDTLNKMLKQLETLQVNLTSSNNRMAGAVEELTRAFKLFSRSSMQGE
jgi:hypothetical protein